jgi:hypothetical protein
MLLIPLALTCMASMVSIICSIWGFGWAKQSRAVSTLILSISVVNMLDIWAVNLQRAFQKIKNTEIKISLFCFCLLSVTNSRKLYIKRSDSKLFIATRVRIAWPNWVNYFRLIVCKLLQNLIVFRRRYVFNYLAYNVIDG